MPRHWRVPSGWTAIVADLTDGIVQDTCPALAVGHRDQDGAVPIQGRLKRLAEEALLRGGD